MATAGDAACFNLLHFSILTGPSGAVNYAVRLNGEWQKVPAEMVVKGTNKIDTAIVWLYPPAAPQLRCFMPGAAG